MPVESWIGSKMTCSRILVGTHFGDIRARTPGRDLAY